MPHTLLRNRPLSVFSPVLALLFLPTLSACGAFSFPGVYRINIEQGNIVTQDMIDQLQPGMSRRQVRFIMGTPLVEDTFNADRWDYPYEIKRGDTMIRKAQVTVRFEGDALSTVEGDYLPAWVRAEEASNAPESGAGGDGRGA